MAFQRGLRRVLGLQSQPEDGEAWVRVVEGRVDAAGVSAEADQAVQRLSDAGLEARQERFVLPDDRPGYGQNPTPAQERIRVAVLVLARDRARALDLVDAEEADPISDEELTRQAMQAARPSDPFSLKENRNKVRNYDDEIDPEWRDSSTAEGDGSPPPPMLPPLPPP